MSVEPLTSAGNTPLVITLGNDSSAKRALTYEQMKAIAEALQADFYANLENELSNSKEMVQLRQRISTLATESNKLHEKTKVVQRDAQELKEQICCVCKVCSIIAKYICIIANRIFAFFRYILECFYCRKESHASA